METWEAMDDQRKDQQENYTLKPREKHIHNGTKGQKLCSVNITAHI